MIQNATLNQGTALRRPGWPEMIVGGIAFFVALGITHFVIGPLIPSDQQIFAGLAGLALSGLIGLCGFAAAAGRRRSRHLPRNAPDGLGGHADQ